MRDRKNIQRKKGNTATIANPSLVSTPTLVTPTPSSNSPSATVLLQPKTLARSEIVEQNVDPEQLSEQIQLSPLSHDISRISLRPQAKLSVSQPGDFYERQADTIASRVMRMPAPEQIDEEEIASSDETFQRQILQRQSQSSGAEVDGNLENQLQTTKSGGSPLGADVRGFMETRFGSDFSDVRVHTDHASTQMNQQLQAQAFTHGNHIYYGGGKSPDKSELTAHELTHTIQQTGGLQRKALDRQVAKENKLSAKLTSIQPTIQLRENPQPESDDKQTPVQQPNSAPANADAGQQQQGTPQSKAAPGTGGQGQPAASDSPEATPSAGQKNVANPAANNAPPALSVEPTASQSDDGGGSADIGSPSPAGGGGGTSPDNDPGFKAVKDRTKNAAKQQKGHPAAGAKSAEAQAAATDPNEVDSKAKDRQVQDMSQQQPGQFNAAAFKKALMDKIQSVVPTTLKEADEFKNHNKLDSVKGDLSSQVKTEKQQAAGAVEEKAKEQPNTQGITPKPVTPIPPAQPGAKPADVGAADAAPKPKAEADVSLQAGSKALDQQMADAKITDKQLANSNEPTFQNALESKKSSQTNAATAPVAYRQQEGSIVTKAQDQAQAQAQSHLQGMHGDKQKAVAGVLGHQGQTKEQDEAKRTEVSTHIQGIYNTTKQNVEKILSELDSQVSPLFDQGAATAKSVFESHVDREMTKYKEKRYKGTEGAVLWARDLLPFTTLPPEVNEFAKEGRRLYIQSMDGSIDRVADLVASKLTAAKTAIDNGKQEIQKYVSGLAPSLQQIGKEAAQTIQAKFDELEQNIDNKQGELVDSLAQKYQKNLQEIDTKIDEMKQANKSLWDMAKDEVDGVIKTIIELKNMLMGVLAKAAGAIDKIVDDPIGFLGNLVAGVKQGFMSFAGNIVEHLKAGLMGWLTGALGDAGIEMPENFDLKGIFHLVMQVLGVTYQNIRAKASNKLGEKVMGALEAGFDLFVILKNEGLPGLWQYIQDKIGDLKVMVLDSIKNFVIESVIKAGVAWVISMLNPASAFIKACKAIYDIVMFFIERGSQIMELVNSVLDSVTAIASGNIGGAAKMVENALAKALPVAISFLASLLGLGGIGEKVQEIIKKVRAPIDKAIDWVLGKAAKFASKFKNSKLGKKLDKGKKWAENKKDAAVKWAEDKKEKAHQWVEDKKAAVANKVDEKKKQFLESKAGQKLAAADKWGHKQLEKLEKKKESIGNKFKAIKNYPKNKSTELHEKIKDNVTDLQNNSRGKSKSGNDNKETKDSKKNRLITLGVSALHKEEAQHAKNGNLDREGANRTATIVKQNNPIFQSIKVLDGGSKWKYDYVIQKTAEISNLNKRTEHAENWHNVEHLIGQQVGVRLPSGYSYYEREGRMLIRRDIADNARFEKLSVDENNNICLETNRSNRISKSGKLAANLEKEEKIHGDDKDYLGHQSHHLIPDEIVRNHPLTQAARERGEPAYDLDNALNGIKLPSIGESRRNSPNLPPHKGSHPDWNKFVAKKLDSNWSFLIQKYTTVNIPGKILTQILKKIENQLRADIQSWTSMK